MAAVTIRNLPEGTHRALKLRAAKHGRSTEAEIRAILEEAVRTKLPSMNLAHALRMIGEQFGDIEPEFSRDRTPAGSTVDLE